MKKKAPVNVVIAQSGGPSMVINASLVGAVRGAKYAAKKGVCGRILGARHGIAGVLAGDWIDLKKVPEAKLDALYFTPSSALGSCRLKPDAAMCRKIFEVFRAENVGFFFYIGGNDSADAARIVAEEAEKEGYPLVCYHIPKTIDNDLRSCDHTPGYASAARFVASAIRGDDLDNAALGGVKIDIIMGRDAGFLTAASALARENPGDGPHLIYLPEVPFSLDGFVKDVKAAMKKYGRCVCAVSEGIRTKDGTPVAALFANGEKDSHGNLQLSGTGALGDYLSKYLKEHADVKRVRADTFGYLQRSFPGIAGETDLAEAFQAGVTAVACAVAASKGVAGCPAKGTIAIVRKPGKKYKVVFEARPVADAAKYTRSVPKAYIAKNGHDVTPAFIDYIRPLVDDLPPCARL